MRFCYSHHTNPFRRSASQYRASSSGDFVVLPAAAVTALLLTNLLKAYKFTDELLSIIKMIVLLYPMQLYNLVDHRILH
jgi:hypothetical protein